MRIILLIIFFQLFFIDAFSQSNYQPGLIQKIDGEIIHGWIDYRQWERNPKKILFREKMENESQMYSVKDLSEFAVTGEDTYRKAIVTKDMRPVELTYLTTDTQDTVLADTVFLRELVKSAELSLYELNDEKHHFYIQYSTGDYNELIYKVYLYENGLEKRTIYRQQLLTYLPNSRQDYDKISFRINNARYVEKDLIAIVRLLDNEAVSATAKAKSEKNKPSFFISGGGQVSFIKFKGFPDISDLNYSKKVTPAISIGMDIFSKRSLSDFIIRFELTYSSLIYEGDKTGADNFMAPIKERTYSLKLNNVTPSVAFLYSFLQKKDSYKVYAGVKIGYNFTSYPVNKYVETVPSTGTSRTINDDYVFEKKWLSGSANLGAIISNKFGVNMSFSAFGSFSNYVNFSVAPNIFCGSVSYHFGHN